MAYELDTGRSHLKLLHGNVLPVLKTLPSNSIQCCITSPPFWGMRDYQTATWKGGKKNCKHEGKQIRSTPQTKNAGMPGSIAHAVAAGDCRYCGAKRIDDQIGLEPTPAGYVNKILTVFHE